MIQQEYKNNIADMSEEITTTGFTIEANASVYAMLTQNVYNDPTLAVVREWSTNACDACLAAGVPVEYDVHLPNSEEPEFYVRDYGTGLHPEDIVGLFSNLGASTKRESNVYNGTLGIGRMAGLAVAEAFTIESYYEGTRYSYVVSMQEGIPVTLHLGDAPTDERNGLKLGVGVESRAFSQYKEKADVLYKYFDYKPNINDTSVVMTLETAERISDDWFIQNSTDRYDYDNYLIMSQVLYKIPRNSEITTFDFRRLVLKAPPGSVTFNPGRESLTLDKKTTAYVNSAFLRVKEDYLAAGVVALNACKTDGDLVKCYVNITKDAPYKIVQNINPIPMMSHELQQLTARQHSTSYRISQSDAFKTDTNECLHLTVKNSYYKTAKPLDQRNDLGLTQFFNAKHVIVDMKTKYKSALNQYYDNDIAIFWQRTLTEDLDTAIQEAKRYLKALNIPYKLASEIVAKTPTVDKAFLPREGLYVSQVGRGGKVYKSQPLSDPEKGNHLYLPLKHTTPVLCDDTFTFYDYIALYEHLERVLPVPPPPIRGVAKKYQGYVEELDNWVDFETYIKDTAKSLTFRCEDDLKIGRHLPRDLDGKPIDDYPLVLQQYCQNIMDYKRFRSAALYVDSNKKNLLERLGATKEEFPPTYKTTEEDVKKRFPLTWQMLFSGVHNYNSFDKTQLITLAKIEDFYALHSTE